MADLEYKILVKDLCDIVQYVDNANDKDQYSKSQAVMWGITKGIYEKSSQNKIGN